MTTQPSKKSVVEDFANIQVLAQKLGLQTHAGAAMLVAAASDRMLEDALTIRMDKLNREMRDKLLGDYGTLRSFSAKIDVAFALGLVDRQHYKLLTAIRKCRNLSPIRGISSASKVQIFRHSSNWEPLSQ